MSPSHTRRPVVPTFSALILLLAATLGPAPGCSGPSAPPSADLPAGTTGQAPAKAMSIPDFSARSSDGSPRSRADLVGHPTVLWFFLLAGTADDTSEARAFAEKASDWATLGVHVVGVGFDEPEKTRNWVHNENLPFEIWTDVDHALANTLGAVPNQFAILPTRTTVLLDAKGGVILRYEGSLDPARHPAEVLADASKVLKKP
jgi:thioredoxin-dependent peroxiredoxin